MHVDSGPQRTPTALQSSRHHSLTQASPSVAKRDAPDGHASLCNWAISSGSSSLSISHVGHSSLLYPLAYAPSAAPYFPALHAPSLLSLSFLPSLSTPSLHSAIAHVSRHDERESRVMSLSVRSAQPLFAVASGTFRLPSSQASPASTVPLPQRSGLWQASPTGENFPPASYDARILHPVAYPMRISTGSPSTSANPQ